MRFWDKIVKKKERIMHLKLMILSKIGNKSQKKVQNQEVRKKVVNIRFKELHSIFRKVVVTQVRHQRKKLKNRKKSKLPTQIFGKRLCHLRAIIQNS